MVGEGDQVMPLCKYGCNTEIAVKQTPGGWRPFEQDGKMHDCPKSPYNQKKLQGDSYRTPKDTSLTDIEQKLLSSNEEIREKLELVIRKLDAIYSGRAFNDTIGDEMED